MNIINMAEVQGNFVRWSDYSNVLLMQLYQLYTENFLLDTCLICGHVQMYAHKAVLAAASPFFKQQLSDYGSGQNELRINSETLGMEIIPDDVQTLLHFIYRGEVHVPHERMSTFFELGQRLQVAGLYNCNQLMDFNLSPLPNIPSLSNSLCMPYQIDTNTQVFNNDTRPQTNPFRIPDEIFNPSEPEMNYTPQPYIGVKSLDNLMNADPPKLCESLKVDTGSQNMGASVSHTSFSDLCTTEPDLEHFGLLPPDRSLVNKPNTSFGLGFPLEIPQLIPPHSNNSRDDFPLNEDSSHPILLVSDSDYQNEISDITNTIRVNPLIGAINTPTRDFQPLQIDLSSNSQNDSDDISLIDSVIASTSEQSSRDTTLPNIFVVDDSHLLSTPEDFSRVTADQTALGNDVIVEKEIINTLGITCPVQQDEVDNYLTVQQSEPFDNCSTSENALNDAGGRLKVKDSVGGVSLHDTSQCQPSVEDNPASDVSNDGTTENCKAGEKETTATPTLDVAEEQTKQIPKESNKVTEKCDHKCDHCSFESFLADDLTLHLWNAHNIGEALKCLICDFTSVILKALIVHADTHMDNPEIRCCICDKICPNKFALKKHIRYHKAKTVKFKCNLCDVSYCHKLSLIKHCAAIHSIGSDNKPLTNTHKCPNANCSFTTLIEFKLQNHIARHHPKEKKYKCDECNYSTIEHRCMVNHKRIHTKEKPFVCDICGHNTATHSSLARHKRSHTKAKPYKCKECGQQYADSKRLKDHMMKHSNIKPFMCHLCGYSCRRKDNLQLHVKTHLLKKAKKKNDPKLNAEQLKKRWNELNTEEKDPDTNQTSTNIQPVNKIHSKLQEKPEKDNENSRILNVLPQQNEITFHAGDEMYPEKQKTNECSNTFGSNLVHYIMSNSTDSNNYHSTMNTSSMVLMPHPEDLTVAPRLF